MPKIISGTKASSSSRRATVQNPDVPRADTPLLRRLNERRVLDTLLAHGPLSRTALCRAAAMAGPTVTKAAEALLDMGLIEELAAEQVPGRLGRPEKRLRLASRSTEVIGVVIDAGRCTVVPAGLDGRHDEDRAVRFVTPATYDELLTTVDRVCREVVAPTAAPRDGGRAAGAVTRGLPAPADAASPLGGVRGIGISVPGLVSHRLGEIVLSPNVHMLDRHAPARDLERRLGVPCRMFQESHSLCLGESMFGAAKGLTDFAMLDVSTGLGLGVMSGGRLLTGASGLAGELGHVRIDPRGHAEAGSRGERCGCGNRGCLETVATDSALARLVSESIGRSVTTEEAIAGLRDGSIEAAAALDRVIDGLAVAVSAVVNIFNPATLFVHGGLLAAGDDVFPRLLDLVKHAALTPSLADCRIVRARGSKRTGALAGIIDHVTNAAVPRLGGLA
jgi:predicted NBD/HSP70 family sugar kinase